MKKCLKKWVCMFLAVAIIATNVGSFTSYAVESSGTAGQSAVEAVETEAEETVEEPDSGEESPETEETPDAAEEEESSGQSSGQEASGKESSGQEEAEAGDAAGLQAPETEDAATDETGEAGLTIEAEPETEEESGDEENPYSNYYFGDSAYNGNYIYGYDEEGNEIPELYTDDLETIIAMAEDGMDLAHFFRGTIFSAFYLEDLYSMREEGYSFDRIVYLYLNGKEMPEWMSLALAYGNDNGIMLLSEEGTVSSGPSTLTASGVTRMSQSELGVISALGSSVYHSYLVQLRATGDDGAAYSAFCASYGGSYRTGYTYTPVDYSECVSPNGRTLTSYQYNLLTCVVNTYYKATSQQSRDYAAAQLIIWYIINNMPDDSVYFDPDKAWTEGGMREAAVLIGGEDYAEFIRLTILSYSFYINMWWDGTLDMDNFSPVDYYPGQHATLQFWSCDESNSQWIITWGIGTGTVEDGIVIPYIDNYYMEKEAVTEYTVEITKESIITNELLEGFQFEVVESEADGYALDYEVIRGTYAEDGEDYPNATIEAGDFGQTTSVTDPVPYLDDDVQPSGGEHRTVLTTDENGYASTTFVHTHTFKEFYSECYSEPGIQIDYTEYQALWAQALESAAEAGGETLTVSYMGTESEMDASEIQAIYESQQVVYTQTQEQASSTIESLYDAYCARTHTYTVTELNTYTRAAASDSNGNVLEEIELPLDGYRKDVKDATTIGPYVEVVANGGTMAAGGTNDQDDNTEEYNVTDEPWYNQIFINKTDLESGNQILYDTEFEIYEYYQYQVELSEVTQRLYPGRLLKQFLTEYGSQAVLSDIASAKLVVTNEYGTEYLNQELDVSRLQAAVSDQDSYVIDFSVSAAGSYEAALVLTMDSALSVEGACTKVVTDGVLEEMGDCTCETECSTDVCPVCRLNADYCALNGASAKLYRLMEKESHEVAIAVVSSGTMTTADGGTITSSYDQATNITTYIYTEADGTIHTLTSTDNCALVDAEVSGSTVTYTFQYEEDVFTGIYLYSSDGETFTGEDDERTYVSVAVSGSTYTFYYYASGVLENGAYEVSDTFLVSAASLSKRSVNKDVDTDIHDYTTWGQENYEIVRVTADIAKQMGWSDTTIGMYTVHRLSATDAYAGTTFSSAYDETTGEAYGYHEYGTLYYTQANLGNFAIVEKTAPADGSTNGYLGNYSDRDYSKLSDESSQKNNDGDSYATDASVSTVKMVHYIDLCTDTNQYASYMLTDGYQEYDDTYYTNYVESLDDPAGTATEDGYDALYYAQSSLISTIGLERFALDGPMQDVLNEYWDRLMNEYLYEKSGILVNRDSDKTDTYFGLLENLDVVMNFVGTTINNDSFDDNLSAESEITYQGTWTDTQINYHSYSVDADALNARDGFNSVEYLQAGTVTYDDGAQEKQARFYGTEGSVSLAQGYAFIDERTYGFIRFTKYDSEAERYVEGDLADDYEAGTDHADADLDGAIYSLYVAESNTFTVEYYEGTYDGQLFRAQPLTGGGFRVIWDADEDATDFTDTGANTYTDYPHAYLSDGKLYFDYTDSGTGSVSVTSCEETYYGIQHPDGMYGGAKHNGWFAVLEEQQVFIDTDSDGYADTWTLQDVTLMAGAKVASAEIRNGELQINGLYLGDYDLVEEIRDSIVVFSTNNDDRETSEIKWLSFAAGYLAETDEDGNPVKHSYSFPYSAIVQDGTVYAAEQVYVQKDTVQVSDQEVVKGAGFQLKKVTSSVSSSSNNTATEALEGAGFTVYLISELSLIQDGTIAPAFNEDEGNMLVHNNDLVALFDDADNMVGYQFTKEYIAEHQPFTEKYGADYDEDTVNRLIYVAGHGYYYTWDILDAYRNQYYSNETQKWDFSAETDAIARMYEDDEAVVAEINADYAYVENRLNNGSPCEWYGVNGISDGWVATGVKNEYRLSELFTNHNGSLRSPELPWGAYLVIETTTPEDVFTVDPIFVTVTDSSATANRAKTVSVTDASFVASLVLVKRDAQSGQDVLQSGVSYRIWDYTNNQYVHKYLLGENGALTMVAQYVFTTDDNGGVDAVASLEVGKYRIEEITAPEGYYNLYWDQGNPTEGETLGGVGTDSERATEDNLFLPYYGTVDFEVTTDRRYQSSGIVSSGNLDYIYIGEDYFNDEAVGKLSILKTGEVLVGYSNTDGIEYADEYTDVSEAAYNSLKASAKDRAVFEEMKDYYDLGRDGVEYREVVKELTGVTVQEVDYLVVDAAGMRIAAAYYDEGGTLRTMNGGSVTEGEGVISLEYELSTDTYEGASLKAVTNLYIYSASGDIMDTAYLVTDTDGQLVTNDGGLVEQVSGDTYTVTWQEAIYDADINYAYVLTLDDGTEMNVRLVTYGIYLGEDGEIIRQLSGGGYSVTDTAGDGKEYPDAVLTLAEENTGTTFDFVYEERPLAGATYEITAAEDIKTQDGGDNYWFREGDIVATVTTGADGEIVSYAPAYKTAEDAGGGSYDYTYYYGNSDGTYTSLTGEKSYEGEEFATSGAVTNEWIESRMSDLDIALFGVPAYTDETLYPNTFYREGELSVIRRLYRAGGSSEPQASDYVTRLEGEGGLTSESAGIATETSDGYRLSYTSVKEYPGAKLTENGDSYTLTLADGNTIEAAESETLYRVTGSSVSPWAAGDIVEKTAAGYLITHTDACETAESQGASTDGAADLGYTYRKTYASATLKENDDGTFTLFDADGQEIVTMEGGLLVTEAGGYVEKTSTGYEVTYYRYTDYSDNSYVDASLAIDKATLVVKSETYTLFWDTLNQHFTTASGTLVTLSDDYSSVTVTTGNSAVTYEAFDLTIEYTLRYAEKEDIVHVENDGTLGTVSVYLPLGKYNVQEIATPYGFLISDQMQTVEFTYADQIKEVVFNTAEESTEFTDATMDIWLSKALSWFVGGVNTLGEQLKSIFGVNFWTWGTYGDAEAPYYGDAEGFLSFYDLRVKAWSDEKVPETPEEPGNPDEPEEPDTPEDDRHPDSEENQWKLGVGVYKSDVETGEALGGAKFGLYTSDDIYNVDGKLLVSAGTLLATATTDESGFANFAVDIALMSKWLDEEASDDTLIYEKSVVYTYSELTDLGDGTWRLSADGCDDLILLVDGDGYVTESGQSVTLNTAAKTASYQIAQSIDGNTAVNSGKFYIKELTPPDGYLLDDTVYDVQFVYDDEYTMYIPVYAKHANEPTEVTLTKYDLTGEKEVPGAQIAVYKVNDVNDVDADGLISHADDNLTLIESWTSTEEAHSVTGLLLSNTEWARLNNQEVRENIYIFRELIPADGYVSATDIEFKIYQVSDEVGNWLDENGNLYGYEVLVRLTTCDQDYLSGTIAAPNENADDWTLRGEEENTWDYSENLTAITAAKWLLINGHLVVFISEDATQETITKVLREEDFEELRFNDVYLEFGGDAFEVDFYEELRLKERAEDSYLGFTQMWTTLDDIHVAMYDDTTKLAFNKQDIVTGEDVIGATIVIMDKETGEVIDSWVTGEDGYDENGNALPHYIEGELIVGRTYIMEETLAPTEDGYVKSNSVEFTISDTGEIQRVVMQDDFTKLKISKQDIVTGEELEGALLELWTADVNGEKAELIESWVSGSDGYDEDGKPLSHYVDYLPTGNYILTETMAPEDYLEAEDVAFTVTETGILQTVIMYDETTRLTIYKYRTGTTEYVAGATIKIYRVPEEYLEYLQGDIIVQADGGVLAEEPENQPAAVSGGGTDLSAYVSNVSLQNVTHGADYGAELWMEYAVDDEDMESAGYCFTQLLPDSITLDESYFEKAYDVYDGDTKAFSYQFSKSAEGIQLAVAFEQAYVDGYDTFRFYLTMEVTVSESAADEDGNLVLTIGSMTVTVPTEEITELDSEPADAQTIVLTEEDLCATVVTEKKAMVVKGLTPGWYIAMETNAPNGYILDSTPQVFRLLKASGEQALYFYNTAKSGGGGGGSSRTETPETTGTPLIGTLTLRINGGSWWNNVRTEDNGEDGYSILLKTGRNTPGPIVLAGILVLACAAIVITTKRRKEENGDEA